LLNEIQIHRQDKTSFFAFNKNDSFHLRFANLRLIALDILSLHLPPDDDAKYSNENLKYVPQHNEINSDILLN
jgi:hypothetical protein